METFHDKIFICDNNPGEGVLIIDSDLRGIWATGDQFIFKQAFPRTYKLYEAICIHDYHKRLGTCLVNEEDGYRVAVLFTKEGTLEHKDIVLPIIEVAIDDLLRKIPSDVYLYSGILGRMDKCFPEIQKIIRNKIKAENRIWNIYRYTGDKNAYD